MKIAVSSLGTSLDAWAGGAFGICSQFLVVDTESLDFVVISVPPEQMPPRAVSVGAIRAIATQGAEVVITGLIKDICRQAMVNLGIKVIDGIGKMTVREAVSLYTTNGEEALSRYEPAPIKIAVASHGSSLDATLSQKGVPCTSFVLVDPRTMQYQVIRVETADSLAQASVNAVRAAARSGAAAVITSQIRPECCTALQTLAIDVFLADEGLTIREAIEAYRRGELGSPPQF